MSALEQLLALGIPEAKATYALDRFNGRIEHASDWVFGDGAEWEPPTQQMPAQPPNLSTSTTIGPVRPPGLGSDDLIDLARQIDDDDAELSKAIAASMLPVDDPSSSTSSFGHAPLHPPPPPPPSSTSAAASGVTEVLQQTTAMANVQGKDNSMALIPTTHVQGLSLDDQNLARAMQESVTASQELATDRTHPDNVPRASPADTPVALYSSHASLDYAAGVLQALEAVPQLRSLMFAVGTATPNAFALPSSEHDLQRLAQIRELFEAMEETNLSYIDIATPAGPNASPSLGPPVRAASEFIEDLNTSWLSVVDCLHFEPGTLSPQIEKLLKTPRGLRSLFETTGAPLGRSPTEEPDGQPTLEFTVKPDTRTIHGCLESVLWEESMQAALVDPAEVLVLPLTYPGTGPRVAFEVATEFFVDRYLEGNALSVSQLRAEEGVLKGEEETLQAVRARLTTVNGKNVRNTLEEVLEHYDKHAKPSNAPSPKVQLEKIRTELDVKLQCISSDLTSIAEKRRVLFDSPELTKCRYDLRAILYHDGLPGLGHIYTYIRDRRGNSSSSSSNNTDTEASSSDRWFKVSEGRALEVPASQALGDHTGLHLGAGPYMLLYSKAEDCWPDELPTLVEEVEERRKSWESSKRSSMMSFAMVEPGTGATTTTTTTTGEEQHQQQGLPTAVAAAAAATMTTTEDESPQTTLMEVDGSL